LVFDHVNTYDSTHPVTDIYSAMDSLGSTQRQLGICTAAWTGLFLILRTAVFPKRSATFSNVVVSWLHAFFASGLAIYLSAVEWSHPLSNYGAPPTKSQNVVLTVSLAYFVYDAICCELIKHDLANLLHHISTIVGLAVGVLQQVSGPELTVCLVLMEASNPCLHSRAIFKEMGLKESKLATANDLLFALAFFVCRVIFGPFVVYYTLISSESSAVVKAGGLAIQIVSVFWFWKIVQVVAYKSSKPRKDHRL